MKFGSLFLACAALVIALSRPAAAQTESQGNPLEIGKIFPYFSLRATDGRQVALDDFKGKAILLSFWSCHTDTCFTSVRVLDELIKEYADRGLVAPTICSEVPEALAKDAYAGLLQQCGTGQIVLIDHEMQLAKRLGVTEFPTTVLVDRNFSIWQVITGVRPLLTDEFRQLVKSLVAE